MLHNSAKANWTIEELGWQLVPLGNVEMWDGQLGWFNETLKRNQSHLEDRYVRDWHRAAFQANSVRNGP